MIIGTKIWCIFAFVILTHAAGFLPDLGEFGHPVRRIGAGSASSVYLYRVVLPRQDKDTSKSFAVKIFDPKNPHESRAAYEERIRLESFLARTLGETHHGFVQVHDLLMRNGSWYQIMDYHPYALLPMLAESPMDLDQVACLFKQICEAVYAMHVEMGIAHRDLKLDNVVLSHEGVVKIIDFGGALVGRFPLQPRHEVIQGHGLEGTEPYAAPETYAEKKYDPFKADIWSLGIMLYGLWARDFPWNRSNMDDGAFRKFDSDDETFMRMLPEGIRSLARRMLEPDPSNRATIFEIMNDPWVRAAQVCVREGNNTGKTGLLSHKHGLKRHWKLAE